MYATPHTVTGFLVFKYTLESIQSNNLFNDSNSIPYLIAFGLAFISHLLLDYIDERGLTTEDRFTFDILPSIFLYLVAILSGNFWMFFLGSVAGNMPDLIDKKLYLSIFYPTKFTSTRYFHWQKQIIFPSPTITKSIGYISALAGTLFMIL